MTTQPPRRAAAYRRKRTFILHAWCRTVDGVWAASSPHIGLPGTCADSELGEALRRTLEGSIVGVAHPADWVAVQAPILALAGVKSWGALMKGAACAELEDLNGEIAITQVLNDGTPGGLGSDSSKRATLRSPGPDELGRVVREFLNAPTAGTR